MARPIIKWVGGKSRLTKHLVPLVPRDALYYHEPFCGSAALYLALLEDGRSFVRAKLGDMNRELIETYYTVSRHPEAVIEALQAELFADVSLTDKGYVATNYYGVRRLNPEWLTPEARAARFLFLNRFGYNGLYRVNSRGECNVPVGRFKSEPRFDLENLRLWAEAMDDALLYVGPFDRTLMAAANQHPRGKTVVYFDPPYPGVYTGYTKGGFDEQDHRRLADYVEALTRSGVLVILSIGDHPLSRELYSDYHIIELSSRNSVSCKTRSRRGELVVINFDPPEVPLAA